MIGLNKLNASYSYAITSCLVLLLWGCGQDKTPTGFTTPAATFKTYRDALAAQNFEKAWTCFSRSYQSQVHEGDFSRWLKAIQQGPEKSDAVLQREISAEKIINDRIGYLLFDSTTLPSSQVSPFFYFIREGQSWKITSHLDSTFHQELENAIDQGQFKLPLD